MSFQACHSTLLAKFALACEAVHGSKMRKRRRLKLSGAAAAAGDNSSDDDDGNGEPHLTLKQSKLVTGQSITQRLLDD